MRLSSSAVVLVSGLAAAGVFLAAEGAPVEDLVSYMPGYGDLGAAPWYSGHLHYQLGAKNISTHYVLVKSSNPADDASSTPLIFWSNGGPGASSLYGLMTELGPLLLNGNSLKTPEYARTGIPTLFPNADSSWSTLGDVLVFDAPAPVGFSYCDGNVGGAGTSCGDWDDGLAASNNYAALTAFYEKFPELRSRELYLTGESYAGVYIPTMAREVLQANTGRAKSEIINLKGFAVGDACAGTKVLCGGGGFGPWFDVQFMAGHGQFSSRTYSQVLSACGENKLKYVDPSDPWSPDCQSALDTMNAEIGGYYAYGLYDECEYQNDLLLTSPARPSHTLWRGDGNNKPALLQNKKRQLGLNDYACGGGGALTAFTDSAAVRTALHIPAGSKFFMADNGEGFVYNLTEENLIPFYRDVAVGQYKDRGVRAMVYNGDTDPCINVFVAENWTQAIGLEVEESWRPWTTDGCQKMGGYVTTYDGLKFVTIRGATHMVPTSRPAAAKELLSKWLSDEKMLSYDATCTAPHNEL